MNVCMQGRAHSGGLRRSLISATSSIGNEAGGCTIGNEADPLEKLGWALNQHIK